MKAYKINERIWIYTNSYSEFYFLPIFAIYLGVPKQLRIGWGFWEVRLKIWREDE